MSLLSPRPFAPSRSTHRLVKAFGVLSLLVSPTLAHAQNLLLNPGFETVGVNGPSTTSTQSNVSFVGVSGAANWSLYNFGGYVAGTPNTLTSTWMSPSTLAGGGNAMLYVTTNSGVGALYQGFSTGSSPARATFSLFVVSGSVLADLSINAGPSDGSILTGVTGGWKTFTFVSTSPADQIRFFTQDVNTRYYIDNVTVTATAAAPEPSAIALFLPVLAAGAGVVRRRQAAQMAKAA